MMHRRACLMHMRAVQCPAVPCHSPCRCHAEPSRFVPACLYKLVHPRYMRVCVFSHVRECKCIPECRGAHACVQIIPILRFDLGLQVNVQTGQRLEFHLEAYLHLAQDWQIFVMTKAMAQESEPCVHKRVIPALVNMRHAHARASLTASKGRWPDTQSSFIHRSAASLLLLLMLSPPPPLLLSSSSSFSPLPLLWLSVF